jgi:arabinan endo-1,5-alpha-L-arabinosidase
MATGSWTLHGNLSIPSNPDYNLIDPNLLVIPSNDTCETDTYLLSFGSFWEDIFQIPLQDPPLQVADSSPIHLEYNKTFDLPRGQDPSEGSFQFMWTPKSVGKRFFYLFFSSGYCCTTGFDIPTGEEYKIMVCRSEGPSGPFVDKEGRSCLTQNGGTLVYGSLRSSSSGIVYAPGGQGVLYDADVDGGSVVLYYHYSESIPSMRWCQMLSVTVANFTNVDHPATFGWNKLDFDEEGWPYVTTLSGNTTSAG